MGRYTLYFEWPQTGPVGDREPHNLEAETLEQARIRAAMIYAGASFRRIPPQAYRIEGRRGEIVYRFPEAPQRRPAGAG